ncbi:monooxygenase [Dispira simplex]|nr:monooxygenase [Dispira simplex]
MALANYPFPGDPLGLFRAETPFRFAKPIRRVAIIGAGPSGLACANALVAANRRVDPAGEIPFTHIQVFEQKATVGGTWCYSPVPDPNVTLPSTNPLPNHLLRHSQESTGSLYENLYTNLPTDIMGFPDFPFPQSDSPFVHRSTVYKYLQDYVTQRDLLRYIRFNTQVMRLTWCDDTHVWQCTVRPVKVTSLTSPKAPIPCYSESFDAVMVCNGHFNTPFIPEFPGLAKLAAQSSPGVFMHSHQYKHPGIAQGKSVLVVGGGPSAQDIIREILPLAQHVHQSVRTPEQAISISKYERGEWNHAQHATFTVHPGLERFDPEERWVYFRDQSGITLPDLVIFATGYLYSLPFLPQLYQKPPDMPDVQPPSPDEVLITDGWDLHNIFYQLFYIPNPTLSFPVIMSRVTPFPLAHYQAQLLACVYSGKTSLPDQKAMRKQNIRDIETGMSRPHHVLEGLEAPYNDLISHWINDPEVINLTPPWWIQQRFVARELRLKYLGY